MKTIDDTTIIYYIGQNSKENDSLFETMPSYAHWFHLDNSPSAHVYAVKETKLTKDEIKKAAGFVRIHSKGQGKVIFLKKEHLKLIGGGMVELLKNPKKA